MSGMTDKQIAVKLGVSEDTVNEWKKVHPEFSESLKIGKEEPDSKVEASLFRRATGYKNTKAVKIFMPAGFDEPVYAPYIDHVQPDVTACIFWLKNRRPDRWRDKQELEHTGSVNVTRDLSKLSPEELTILEKIVGKIEPSDPS